MLERECAMGKSQIFTIDEVVNRTEKSLRLEEKYKVRRIGWVKGYTATN